MFSKTKIYLIALLWTSSVKTLIFFFSLVLLEIVSLPIFTKPSAIHSAILKIYVQLSSLKGSKISVNKFWSVSPIWEIINLKIVPSDWLVFCATVVNIQYVGTTSVLSFHDRSSIRKEALFSTLKINFNSNYNTMTINSTIKTNHNFISSFYYFHSHISKILTSFVLLLFLILISYIFFPRLFYFFSYSSFRR